MNNIKNRNEFLRGVMIFAYNNEIIDYIKLAAYCASRVKKFLNVPVCLVTDDIKYAEQYKVFDLFRVIDSIDQSNIRNYTSSSPAQFKNQNRFLAQSITPFFETIIIDSDYIVSSEKLNSLWHSKNDFMIQANSIGITGEKHELKIAPGSFDAFWATVIYFKNTELTRKIFLLVKQIYESWPYFRELYKIETTVYRNDYSFAIALQMLTGGSNIALDQFKLPFSTITTNDHDWVDSINDRSVKINYQNEVISIDDMDIHVLHKQSLLDRYIQFTGDLNG